MNLSAVLDFKIPAREQAYTSRDAILYALGVGLGDHPLDTGELPYAYEQAGEHGTQRVMPTFAMTLAHPGFWLREPALDIDWVGVLHTEQYLVVKRPMKPEGRVHSMHRVTGISDRGADKGATLYMEKRLIDSDSGEEIAIITSGVLCRKDGGCGSQGATPPAMLDVPADAPDLRLPWKIADNAALIYRLSGDVNPLHADPAVARKAGFERPILHGLCTMGIAAQLLQRHVGGQRDIRSMSCRFTKPVFPGDTLEVQVWKDGGDARFQVIDTASGKAVLGRGAVAFA